MKEQNMKVRIRSAAGWYCWRNGGPAWTDDRGEARIFPTKRFAQGVVRILKQNRIPAAIEPVEQPCDGVTLAEQRRSGRQRTIGRPATPEARQGKNAEGVDDEE
jgi:hypothetical protein